MPFDLPRRGHRPRRRHGAEQHVHAIFPVGQTCRRARRQTDRLRLVGRKHDLARREQDHFLRRLLLVVRGSDILQLAFGCHPPKLGRDAIGSDIVADIVEDDLRPAAAVEHDPGRRHQQIADPGVRRRSKRQDRSGEDEPGKTAE